MRRITVATIATLHICLLAAPVRAQTKPTLALVLVDSRSDVEHLLATQPSAVALGVLPDQGHNFIVELYIAVRRMTSPSVDNERLDLDEWLKTLCVDITYTDPRAYLERSEACRTSKGVLIYGEVADAVALSKRADLTIVVGGVSHNPPENSDFFPGPYAFTIGFLGKSGLLDAGDTGRPGVITPYDLDVTILHFFGLPFSEIPGHVIHVTRFKAPLEHMAALRARFERDAGTDSAPSQTTTGFGIGCGFFGVLAGWRRKRKLAEMFARAGALVPLGYLAGMFIQTGNGTLRSIPVAVAFVTGAVARPKDSRKFCGIVLLATAAIISLLTIAAALRPNGEPSLSLWGDPLVSWRFFGLRNHLAAFVAGGALLGALLLKLNIKAIIAVTLAAVVIVGAPRLGANFIGVLTLAFAAVFAIIVVVQKQPRWWHAIAALATGALATAIALLSDSISPVSHGGRAVFAVKTGGFEAGWRMIHDRLVLDYREVVKLGAVGYSGFVLCGLAMVVLFIWAWRARNAAVLSLSAAAFLALFVEDSGFYTGGILSLFPAIGFTLARASDEGTTTPGTG